MGSQTRILRVVAAVALVADESISVNFHLLTGGKGRVVVGCLRYKVVVVVVVVVVVKTTCIDDSDRIAAGAP
jgi:hypothetical protein